VLPTTNTGVSVLVATARPDQTMDACVAAIARGAARVSEPVELIVIDDRPAPAAGRRPAREVIDGLAIRRIWSTDAGVSGQADARNLGAAAASYDLLALTDDDTVPDPRWLELGIRRLRSDPSLAGVEGAIRVDLTSPIDAVRSRIVVNQRGGDYINASMFYRAAVYRAVGGARLMWRKPPINYREDTDLAERIQRDAGPIGFEPDAFVVHPAEAVTLRRLVWLGRCFLADAVLIRLHPDVFGSPWRRPLARLRIRLAIALTVLVPGLTHRRTRRLTAILVASLSGAISAQFELEIRSAGLIRGPLAIIRDTGRRLPRGFLWGLAAGSARIQGEAMVRLGLVEIPPERPEPLTVGV
jgi:GT2 family glycosyltransferase